MKVENLESIHIMWAAIALYVTLIVISLIWFEIEERKAMLKAGCDYTFVQGKDERVWVNCKCTPSQPSTK